MTARAQLESHPGNTVVPGKATAAFRLGPRTALVETDTGLFLADAGWLIAPPWKLFFPYQRGQMPLWLVMLLAKIDGRLRPAGDLQLLEDIFEVMPDSLIAQV